MPTQLLPCKCQHEYQDRLYGMGMRVFNYLPDYDQGKGGWRCTVCKREQGRQQKTETSNNTEQVKASSKHKRKRGKKQK